MLGARHAESGDVELMLDEVADSLRARNGELEAELDALAAALVEAQDQLLALYDLARSSRDHFGLAENLHALTSEAARLLSAGAAALLLPPTVAQHPAALIDMPTLHSCLQRVQQSQQGFLLCLPPGAGQLSGLLAAPIWLRGAVSAVLVVANKRSGQFTAADLKLAQAIAEQAGVQIERALLYQELLSQMRLQTEMDLARVVQARLLPAQPPACAGLELWAESRPARQVGGDFYDIISAPGRPALLTVGDVAGKGIAAALVMAMVLPMLRSAARFLPQPQPAAILARATANLYDDFTSLGTLATIFVASYCSATRTLSYANAGHAPVIFCPAQGPARLLEADAPPLGVLPEHSGVDRSLRLCPGDLLVVATDGFSEASGPDAAIFGHERLIQLIAARRAEAPAQIARALFAAIDEYSKIGPNDDCTLIVLKVTE